MVCKIQNKLKNALEVNQRSSDYIVIAPLCK